MTKKVAYPRTLAFTRELHSRFPRELRDQIYDEILQSRSTLYDLREYSDYPKGKRRHCKAPALIKASVVYREVVRELIKRFYTASGVIQMSHLTPISQFLKKDFFLLGITPSDSVFPGIQMNISIPHVNVATFSKDMQPLLHADQKWSKGFKVGFHINGSISFDSAKESCAKITSLIKFLKIVAMAVEERSGTINVTIRARFLAHESGYIEDWWAPASRSPDVLEKEWKEKMDDMRQKILN